MIRIGKSIDALDSLASLFYQEVQTRLRISEKLIHKITGPTVTESNFYNQIQSRLKDIIVAKPNRLEEIIGEIQPYHTLLDDERRALANPQTIEQQDKESEKLKDEILSIFNYTRFTQYNNGAWAYNHADRLGMNVCPYCNASYTHTIRTPRGKTRPEFDHFYFKAKYPYLAVSFYNLVPSCHVCNSNLKWDAEFKFSTNVHPFIEGVEDTAKFVTGVKSVDYLAGVTDFEIELKMISTASQMNRSRVNANAEVFHIKERYSFHKVYAGDIIRAGYIYTESDLSSLLLDFKLGPDTPLIKSREEIFDLLFGRNLHELKFHKEPLTKLTKNILEEIGIRL